MAKKTSPQSKPQVTFSEAMHAVEKKNGADLYAYCGRISSQGDAMLLQALRGRKERKENACFLLTTLGGDPDAAYRIAKSFQRFYKNTILFVDWYCKSAGTLIAIGSNEIVMSDSAELGPLDTQLLKPDEIGELTSGLTSFEAIKTLNELASAAFKLHLEKLQTSLESRISTRLASDIAKALVTGSFGPIFAQIDPMQLGEHARAMKIAKHYGARLSPRGRDGAPQLSLENLDHLVSGYPSHSFVICREDAKEIFRNVRKPSDEETQLMDGLHAWMERSIVGDSPFVYDLLKLAEAIEVEGASSAKSMKVGGKDGTVKQK